MREYVNKEQLQFALSSLLASSKAALHSKSIDSSFAQELKDKGLILSEKILNETLELSVAVVELNKLIQLFNNHMKKTSQLQYPSFVSSPEIVQVKSAIISFEFFLTQKLTARELSLEQEEPIFNECLQLWKNVGLQLSPRETIMFLSRLIQRANGYIPQERFPLPDDTQY